MFRSALLLLAACVVVALACGAAAQTTLITSVGLGEAYEVPANRVFRFQYRDSDVALEVTCQQTGNVTLFNNAVRSSTALDLRYNDTASFNLTGPQCSGKVSTRDSNGYSELATETDGGFWLLTGDDEDGYLTAPIVSGQQVYGVNKNIPGSRNVDQDADFPVTLPFFDGLNIVVMTAFTETPGINYMVSNNDDDLATTNPLAGNNQEPVSDVWLVTVREILSTNPPPTNMQVNYYYGNLGVKPEDEASLVIQRRLVGEGWTELDSTVDTVNKIVSAPLDAPTSRTATLVVTGPKGAVPDDDDNHDSGAATLAASLAIAGGALAAVVIA